MKNNTQAQIRSCTAMSEPRRNRSSLNLFHTSYTARNFDPCRPKMDAGDS